MKKSFWYLLLILLSCRTVLRSKRNYSWNPRQPEAVAS